MECPKCKAIIQDQSKFCPDCGLKLEAPPLGTPKPAMPKKLSSKQEIISLALATIIFGILSYVILKVKLDSFSKSILLFIIGITFLILLVVFVIRLIILLPKIIVSFGKLFIKFVKYLIKRPILIVPTFVFIIIFTFLSWKLFKFIEYKRSEKQLTLIQDYLTQVIAVKFYGDDIQEGRSIPEGINMEDLNVKAKYMLSEFQNINSTHLLDSYYLSIENWMASVVTATQSPENWRILTETPDYFDISLSNSKLEDTLVDSIEKVVQLKEFGDNAIETSNKEAMRYIAARLLVQKHWLESLEVSSNPWIFGEDLNVVYAGQFTSRRKRTQCVYRDGGKIVCLGDTIQMTGNIYRSAHNYTVGEASPEQWTGSWTDAAPMIDVSGEPLGGAGITTEEEEKNQLSPTLQAFHNECSVKGGTVGGTGGVKDRLPTTEDGYTCSYGDNGGCWDFLTYSGGRYMGGAPNCPEEGLMPLLPQNPITDLIDEIKDELPDFSDNNDNDNIEEDSWDGTYYVTFTGGSCNVPGFAANTFSPFSEELIVKNNYAGWGTGSDVPIDANGQAVFSFNINESGVYGQYTDTMTFTRSEDGVIVNGQYSITATSSSYGVSVSVQCSGTYTGYRE